MSEKAQSDELPFDVKRQNGFFGHIISNKARYQQVKGQVKKNWFKDSWVAQAYGIYLKWSELYDKNNEKLPTVIEVTSTVEFLALEKAIQAKISAAIAQALADMVLFDWDSIVSELTSWLKCRIYLENVTRSTELFNNKKYNEAFFLLEKSVIQYQKVKFFPDESEDFMNYKNHFENALVEQKNGLTTGLSILDKKINPNCDSGCLLPGDTTIFLAPTNVGKTTTLINVAIANIMKCKSVLFLSHEGRKEDLMDKFWCRMTSRTKADLVNLYKTDEVMFKSASLWMNKYLTYLSINDPDQLTVENIARIIERKQHEKVTKDGHGYDLLVCDYPAKLHAEMANKVTMQFRQLEHYVYNYFVQLALKHKFHALLAIQTNREASKNNRHQGKHGTQKRLVNMEDVSESWGPMTVATNVLSINRNSDFGDKIIFHICKTRSSEAGISVIAKSDLTIATTHSDALGGVAYRGDSSVANITEDLLKQYISSGKELPSDVVYKLEGA